MPKREAREGSVQIRVPDEYKPVMNIVNMAIEKKAQLLSQFGYMKRVGRA
jgi:hypothetical protein